MFILAASSSTQQTVSRLYHSPIVGCHEGHLSYEDAAAIMSDDDDNHFCTTQNI